MAYGLLYTKDYVTETELTRTLEIWWLDYEDEPITSLQMDPPVVSTDGNDRKVAGVYGSSMRLTLLTGGSFDGDAFLSPNPREFKAVLRQGEEIIFAGYLQGDLTKDLYAPDMRRKFEVTATDSLADLSDIAFKPSDGIFEDRESIRAFLFYALELTGLNLNLVTAVELFDTYMSTSANALNQVTVSPLLFLSEDKVWSVRDVLDAFCKTFYARLFQRGGKWHFVCIDNQAQGTLKAYEYETGSGNQVTGTTNFWHRQEIETNTPSDTTQVQLSDLIVPSGERPEKTYQRPVKRIEVVYDYGPSRSDINGDFLQGGTDGWTFNDGITHSTVEVGTETGQYALQLTGASLFIGIDGIVPGDIALQPDHLTTSDYFTFDEKYATTYFPVKANDVIEIAFDYRAPQHGFLKVGVMFVYKNYKGTTKTTANLYDDLSTIDRDALGSDGLWHGAEKVTRGRSMRHIIIDNRAEDAQGNKIIKSEWDSFSLSASKGCPADGWIVLYLYRGYALDSGTGNEQASFKSIKVNRKQFGDVANQQVVVLENTVLPYAKTTETVDLKIGEPNHSLNYSFLAKLNGELTNRLWSREAFFGPVATIQAVIGSMQLRQYKDYGLVIEGDFRGVGLYYGDTVTFTGIENKVFMLMKHTWDTKTDIHQCTFVELFSGPFDPAYYIKTSNGLARVKIDGLGLPLDGELIGGNNNGGGGGGGGNGLGGGIGNLDDSGIDAYTDRKQLLPPANFLELPKNGIWRIDEDTWEGFDYPPSECIPHGNFENRTNGPDEILTYTDDNGFTAELLKINDVWQIDDATNPGGWVYLPTIEVEQYNEEGEQLGLTGFLKGGKFMNLSQFAIKPGEKLMGLLPKNTVMSGVPVPEDGVPFASINGTYVYTVTDWATITDGPPNLKGKGFLKLSYYNGVVRFLAYDFWGDEINFAYAAIPGTGQAMTAWRIDTDIFCTIERLENTLLLYALKDHNHDDLYLREYVVRELLDKYRLLSEPITMAEIAGLSQSLANKIDVGIFQNAVPGDVIVLGSDGTPVAADPSDAYTGTVSLINAKEGDAYTAVIPDNMLIFPRGAANKRISPFSPNRWPTFSGAIVGGSGADLTIGGTPTSSPSTAGVTQISLDFIYTMNGQERREQRILYIVVEPAAATITAPNAPLGLSATAVSTSQINLSWTDNATNETVQEIERSTASDFTGAVKIANPEANVTTFQDKIGLSPNTLYYYRVRAVNSAGNSAWSTASATTNAETAITSGLHANYYDTVNIRSLGSAATARTDNTINYDVTNDAPTGAAVTTGAYIARWSGKVKPPVSGSYQFSFATNARTRIYFGGVLAVDSFTSDALRTLTFFKTIAANEEVPILIEYLQNNDDTFARLGYQNGATDTVVPTTWLIPENVAPLAIPVLAAAGFDADTIRLSWTLTTDPDSYEVFGGLDSTSVLPLLSNVTAAGTLRTVDVNGLSAGLTFFFQIRSKKNGIYSELSDRVSASTPIATDVPNSAAPVLIGRSTLNTSELTVRFQDNNTGDAETYGFRFQQVNTTAWKYLNSSSGLSDNAADMDMRSYPFAGVARSLVLTNDFFAAKLIRVEVIVEKDGLRSAWSGAQETATPIANQQPDVIYMEAFHLVKDPTTGLWYDDEEETDNSSYHNFYLCEDKEELLLNDDGTPKPGRDFALPSYSYLMFRKLRLRKSVYPVYQQWMSTAYLSNINGGNPSNVMYCAQNIVRTFDEEVIGDGGDDGPIDPPPTTGRNIDYNTAYSFHINLYTMSFTAWNTVKIKQLADTSVAAGFKAIQLSFSPYRVWNNYSSPGAFNADSLTWKWDEINDIINYVCNTKGLKLIVRLHPDMSDFSLDHYAANAETPTLKAAWDSYLDKDNIGSITGLKIDNLTTPPWMLFRKFCTAFKAQYANYWDSGKILVWEFATNRNQEAQIHPNTTTITMPPNFTQYTERTEWMYEMGQVMLSVMSGWEDNQWNVGSWVNEGFQIRGNSMGYSRFTTGFKGMRGNHDSNWSKDERDFHDLIMYTRTKKGTGRYYSVEYFRQDNLVEASAMAQTIKNSMNNGARMVGFVYSDDNFTLTLDFLTDVGSRLSGYHARPLATPQVTPVDYDFSLSSVFYDPYTGPGGMLTEYLFNKNTMQNLPQYMSIVY